MKFKKLIEGVDDPVIVYAFRNQGGHDLRRLNYIYIISKLLVSSVLAKDEVSIVKMA